MSGCCGGRGGSSRGKSGTGAQPTQMPIPPAEMYEVLTASGAPSGRKFQSKVSAQAFADRIGGSIHSLY